MKHGKGKNGHNSKSNVVYSDYYKFEYYDFKYSFYFHQKPIYKMIKSTLLLLSILIIVACDRQQVKEPAVSYNEELDFQCFQHFYGSGDTPQDIDKALPICIEAAKTGAQGSQYAVGMSYLLGIRQEVNKDKAIYWLTKSADRGHTDAIKQLQKMGIEY